MNESIIYVKIFWMSHCSVIISTKAGKSFSIKFCRYSCDRNVQFLFWRILPETMNVIKVQVTSFHTAF